jgi:hypothetical protein
MLLKIMGAEDSSDDDSRKTFQLHEGVLSVSFKRTDGNARVCATFADRLGLTETFDVPGNAYVMTDQGKTVASFGSAPVVYQGYQETWHNVGPGPR